MRAVRYHEHGGPEVLELDEVARPEPGDGDVLVEVRACSVNPVDTYIREGETHVPSGLPKIPGADFAGVVEAVGEGVTAFAPGDRVHGAGLAFRTHGSCAEYVTVPTDLIAPLPGGVDFVEGAAIGHVGVTAWSSVVEVGTPEPLDTVLIHGGSGGVGHVAVQLATAMGARVVTTAGSPGRRRSVEELGADVALDYARADLAEAIADAVDGEADGGSSGGAAVIVDHRPEEYLGLDIDVAADGGHVVLIDGYSVAVDNLRQTRAKDLTITGLGAGSTVSSISRAVGRISRLVAAGDIEVVVDRTYPLADISEAHRAVVEESYAGKIVLVP